MITLLVENILRYIEMLNNEPYKLILFVIDIGIVLFLLIKLIQVLKGTRAWQLVKGIILLIIVIALSELLQLRILNFILVSFITYGLILIIIFQPELRRALEQLGTSKISRYFGIDKDVQAKTKETIYKVVIAADTLAEKKIGALIVIERDIKLKDIMQNGILIDSEVSAQLLVNIFQAKTPLHDGAVIISNNRIAASACMLPLSDDKNISRNLRFKT